MNNSTLLWKSKRKIIPFSLFFCSLYFILAFFVCWFCWFVLLKESSWYGLLAIFITFFYISELYETLNFKSIILTEQGLILKMRWFDTEIFYPYGSFTIKSITMQFIKFDETISFLSNTTIKNFKMLNGFESFGSFENNHTFKELCTQYTQKALETMNLEEKVNLYKLYRANIEIFFNQEIDHNVFIIDFSPYTQEIKTYLKDKNE